MSATKATTEDEVAGEGIPEPSAPPSPLPSVDGLLAITAHSTPLSLSVCGRGPSDASIEPCPSSELYDATPPQATAESGEIRMSATTNRFTTGPERETRKPQGDAKVPQKSCPTRTTKAAKGETVDAATASSIARQVQLLQRTLLSVFPRKFREGAAILPAQGHLPGPATIVELEAKDEGGVHPTTLQAGKSSTTPFSTWPREPLLPLLASLSEDKAYVRGAWCRYEDDSAIHRLQASLQRRRQRHAFSKARRRAPASSTTSQRREDGERDCTSDEDGGDHGNSSGEEDREEGAEKNSRESSARHRRGAPSEAHHRVVGEHQQPEAQWVAEPPALGGVFQWAPWRFHRRRRRTSSPSASQKRARGHAGELVAGTVPPLDLSEVPSLPVLQVETSLPESAHAVVDPMTAEEQEAYARYILSSGKLRHDCQDLYSFLVSRAKELRMQWERQHPFT